VYTQGQQETAAALEELQDTTAGTPQGTQFVRVQADAAGWERWAEGVRVQVRATGQPLVDPTAVEFGRQLFSVFRADQHELEDQLEEASANGAQASLLATAVKVALVVGGSIATAGLLQLTARRVVRHGLGPLGKLANAAGDIAAEGHVTIPYVDSRDEVGELARALQSWQEASTVRTILAEQAPVGICRVDAEGRFLTANARLEKMLGYRAGELVGQTVRHFVHPKDRSDVTEQQESLMRGVADLFEVESRWV